MWYSKINSIASSCPSMPTLCGLIIGPNKHSANSSSCRYVLPMSLLFIKCLLERYGPNKAHMQCVVLMLPVHIPYLKFCG